MLMKKKIIHRIRSQDMINSEVTSNSSSGIGSLELELGFFTFGELEAQ